MKGLTYLKRIQPDKKPRLSIYITYVVIFILYSLMLSQWRYSDGMKEGMSRVNATVELAAKVAFNEGVEEGLNAKEVKERRKTE